MWSLCVLALPIGVIGSNFEQVWNEFDDERAMEREIARSEDQLFNNSACLVDPVVKCRNLIVEVYHDVYAGAQDRLDVNKIFLGKVEIKMELSQFIPSSGAIRLPLQPDLEQSKRAVKGVLSVEYSWQPSADLESGVLVSGKLTVAGLSVQGLSELDWRKDEDLLNPYAVVTVYPRSPFGGSAFSCQRFRTTTIPCTLDPVWHDQSSTFEFRWTKVDIEAKKEAENESMKGNLCLAFDPEGDSKPPDKFELISNQVKSIPHVIEEIKDVKREIEELHQILAKSSQTDAARTRLRCTLS
jgi:hypothetical protein